MIMFSYKLICSLVLLLVVIVEFCDACSCWNRPAQTVFCKQDVVVEATVTSVSEHIYMIQNKYTIDVARTFRTVKGAPKISELYAASEGSLCGMHFELNTKYLIQGRMYGNTFHVSSCSGSKRWDRLTPTEVKVFENGGYDCSCKIKICYSLIRCKKTSKDVCNGLREEPRHHFFEDTFRDCSCVRHDDGKCDWKGEVLEKVSCSGLPPPPPTYLPTYPPEEFASLPY